MLHAEPQIDHFVMAITSAEAVVRYTGGVSILNACAIELTLYEWENSDAQDRLVCRLS
jgi:hypothetical protein